MTANDARLKNAAFAGHAVKVFGEAELRKAYTSAVLFSLNDGRDGPYLIGSFDKIEPKHIAHLKHAMTPSGWKHLQDAVQGVNGGDKSWMDQLTLIVTQGAKEGDGWKIAKDRPFAVNKTFSLTGAFESSKGNLNLEFDAGVDYRFEKDHKAYFKQQRWHQKYTMVRTKAGWKVNGWNGHPNEGNGKTVLAPSGS